METDIADLLPPNLASDPVIRALASSLLGHHADIPTKVPNIWQSIEELKEEDENEVTLKLFTLLKEALGADLYNPNGTFEERKSAIFGALRWQQRRGTPAAIEEILAAFDYTAYVYEGGFADSYMQRSLYYFDTTPADAVPLDEFPEDLRYDPTLGPYEFGVYVELNTTEGTEDDKFVRSLIARAQNARSHLVYVRYISLEPTPQ